LFAVFLDMRWALLATAIQSKEMFRAAPVANRYDSAMAITSIEYPSRCFWGWPATMAMNKSCSGSNSWTSMLTE
jgi:hypothetical protein